MAPSPCTLAAILYLVSHYCTAQDHNIRFDKDTYYDVGGRTLVAMVIAENVTETVNVTILTPGAEGLLMVEPDNFFISSESHVQSFNLTLSPSHPHTLNFTLKLNCTYADGGSGNGPLMMIDPCDLAEAQVIFRTEDITSSATVSTDISDMFLMPLSTENPPTMTSSSETPPTMTSSSALAVSESSSVVTSVRILDQSSPSLSVVMTITSGSEVILVTMLSTMATPIATPIATPMATSMATSMAVPLTTVIQSSSASSLSDELLLPLTTSTFSPSPMATRLASSSLSRMTDIRSSVGMSQSLTPAPPTRDNNASENGVITAIAIVLFLIFLIAVIGVVAMVIALLIARKKRRTHTYYTAGVTGNKFNHYIDVQVRTEEEMREKTPDSKDIPLFETSFVGKGSTTILNDPFATTLTFKGELAAAIQARSQKGESIANGDHSHGSQGNLRDREE